MLQLLRSADFDKWLKGQKWVAGEGPMEKDLKARYPAIRWIGVLPQSELADVYSQARPRRPHAHLLRQAIRPQPVQVLHHRP